MQLFFKCKKRPEIPDQLLCTATQTKGLCLQARPRPPLNPREGLGPNSSQPDPPQPSSPRPGSQEVKEAGSGQASHRGMRVGSETEEAWGQGRGSLGAQSFPYQVTLD